MSFFSFYPISEYTILAPLDAVDLLDHGLLGPGTTGTRLLHKRRLNRFSDQENRDIPLDSSLSSAADAFAIIPVSLISYETLIYVGLSEAKATELWTSWLAQGPRRETDVGGLISTFKDFIVGSFENRVDAISEDVQEWRACLNECGIAVDVQEAILDPDFEYICFSESCLYWVKDTFQMRYAGLECIRRTSREREKQLRQVANSGDNQGGNREVL